MTTGSGAFLGIDLGTSSLKVAVLRDDGTVLAESESGYQVSAVHPGWAETDPADWWTALTESVTAISSVLCSTRILGIGLAGQMHGVALCDGSGNPLRPAVLWPDRRADADLSRWLDLPATDRARLANPIVPGMYGPALAWLAAHEPSVTDAAETALLPKDVIRAGLTGSVATDRTDASASLLWDVLEDDWARQVARRTGIPERLLPDVVPPDTVMGTTSWLAKVIDGGPADVPVIAGAGDTPAALLAGGGGVGLQVNLGTGAQVLLPSVVARAVENPVTHVYGDADGGWYAMAAVQNAGLAVEWARSLLGLDWKELVAILDNPAPGQRTITVLPFLTGERGGLAQPGSRGAWVGLDQRTTREDLARAALEAMAFTVRRAIELLPDAATSAATYIRLTGGGGREHSVQQLVANTLGLPVQRVEIRSASATGAAMLAARGVGSVLEPARRQGPMIDPKVTDGLDEAYRLWLSRIAVADA
ncbi:MAG: xylulokinase [Actinomycetota bacterium]|jgi:xylulokinase|nr:xylulokinase [Actinomycetota bacterium]